VCEGAEESLGNVLTGPVTAQDTLWSVSKEQHTPKVTTFESPSDIGTKIQHGQHGPSTKDTAISDFPQAAYLPKVQLPFFTAPGTCPRKIEIERRKREYAEQNLDKLLADHNITTPMLMPKQQTGGLKSVKLNADPKDPAPFPSYLPLEIFDSTEHDCRTFSEWLQMGEEEGVRKPVPGKALLPTRDDQHDLNPKDPSIDYKWFDVGMLDYDEQSKLWLVQKTNFKGRIVDKKHKPVVDGGMQPDGTRLTLPVQYWVPRVRLMFAAEDPQTFAQRVANAFWQRKENKPFSLRFLLTFTQGCNLQLMSTVSDSWLRVLAMLGRI
jgi:dynein heavy chain